MSERSAEGLRATHPTDKAEPVFEGTARLVDLLARLQTAGGHVVSEFDREVVRCASWPMDLSDWLHPKQWRYPRVRLYLEAAVDRNGVLCVTARPLKHAPSRSGGGTESGTVDFAGMQQSMVGVRSKLVLRMPLGLIEEGLPVGDQQVQEIVRRARRQCVAVAYGSVVARWDSVFETTVGTGLVVVDECRLALRSSNGAVRLVDTTPDVIGTRCDTAGRVVA